MTTDLGDLPETRTIRSETAPTAAGLEQLGADDAPIVRAAIVLKIILLFVLAWNSRFVMDEMWQSGNAKYLFNGFFTTIWPAKAVGYAVFYLPAQWIGWSAKSMLLIGRIETALLACAILALVYASARALGESKLRALLITLVLLSFSNFIERIFRTISEPLAVLFAAAALLVILRGDAYKAQTIVAAGVLSGLAFLATQKSIYFNVALGTALTVDAVLARRYALGAKRCAWLILGWFAPVVAYCLVFGGNDPLRIAQNLVFGPIEVATHGATAYGGLRAYVVQTLIRNPILYAFCAAGMVMELVRIGSIYGRKRIALIFSATITALVFAHNQPWPYVFIMALPFASLWALATIDRFAVGRRYRRFAWMPLTAAIVASFLPNLLYLRHDNRVQLELVTRADSLIGRDDHYFDGIGMLPDRVESTRLWLDKARVLATLRHGKASQAYQGLMRSPPKVILWSYRMDAIDPVVAPLIRHSYVRVAPNIRLAGRRLLAGRPTVFDVPIAGTYQLYSETGEPLSGQVEVDGTPCRPPLILGPGPKTVILTSGPSMVLLVAEGSYAGLFDPGADEQSLFADVYN